MRENEPGQLSMPSNRFWSWRKAILLLLIALFFMCLSHLGTAITNHSPGSSPWQAAADFFSAAFSPALVDQNKSLPADATPFLTRLGYNLLSTIRYAFIAMSIAVPAGLILGLITSRYWWKTTSNFPLILRFLSNLAFVCLRFVSTFMRSIHELIWVLLLFSMLGDSALSACIAIALPFTGTLAKVFSEIIDEQEDSTSTQLQSSGANKLQIFLTARFLQALPDLLTYSFYRLECAIRASAVLGFVGISTIGLSIQQSFLNLYYEEVWTALYVLILTIIIFDIVGNQIRKRLNAAPVAKKATHLPESALNVKTLKKHAPKWKFLNYVSILLLAITLASWWLGPALNTYYSHLTRWERTMNILSELVPSPVRVSGNLADALPWAAKLWTDHGASALLTTLAIATMALLIASFCSYLVIPWASRNIANINAFGVQQAQQNRVVKTAWKTLGLITRLGFVMCRAIPEYILAFILLSLLGFGVWPLVLALAIHNFGILGRLWGEMVENNDQLTAKNIYLNAGNRLQAYGFGILPASSNRQLLYMFYRWETCVRESTVLGMLGISSLGYYIHVENALGHRDIMFYFILLGVGAIFLSDLLSTYLRARLKNS